MRAQGYVSVQGSCRVVEVSKSPEAGQCRYRSGWADISDTSYLTSHLFGSSSENEFFPTRLEGCEDELSKLQDRKSSYR